MEDMSKNSKNLTKHLGLGVGVEGREVNTVEGGLLPETRLAHSLSEQKSVGKGSQVHGTFVGEEVSAWLQERVAGIDETLDLTIPASRQNHCVLGSLTFTSECLSWSQH